MEPVTASPAHLLLQQRKDRDATHSIATGENGASSSFAAYAFGPMTLPDGKGGGVKSESKAQSAPTTGNPLTAPTLSWITEIQGMGATGDAGNTGNAGKKAA